MNVEVSTVDGFQGREKEVIVLSLVRSNQEGELGFVTDFQRLNVAVTRARRLLVVIADSETMEKDKLISSLLKHVEELGLLQTAEEYLSATLGDEIEEIETATRKTVQSKTKTKVQTTKQGGTESTDQAKVRAVKNETKVVPKITDKGIDLSSCLNRKQYNVFEAIATTELNESSTRSENINK